MSTGERLNQPTTHTNPTRTPSMPNLMNHPRGYCLSAVIIATLAACGGGGANPRIDAGATDGGNQRRVV